MKYLIGTVAFLFLIVGGTYAFMHTYSTTTTHTTSTPPLDTHSTSSSYTLAEVAEHATDASCWMAIDGVVYDVSAFIALGQHNPEISRGCGTNATTMFNEERKHSGRTAQTLLRQYAIGTLQ